jgi:excisionase family DNA binding protein
MYPPEFGAGTERTSVARSPLPHPGQLLLTVPQVARLLGMTRKAIYHRAERGQLPGVVRVGRSLRFRRADLLRSVLEGRGLSPR